MKNWLMSLAVSLVVLVSSGAAALVASEEPAEAAFPGKNGQIVFSNSYDQTFVIGPDGSGLRELPTDEDFVVRPQWSPDGRHILFKNVPIAQVPHGAIYVARADGSGWQAVVDDPDAFEIDPQWYPSGRKIAYCAAPIGEDEDGNAEISGDYEIYSLRLDRDKSPVGSPVRLTYNDAYDCPSSVSSDGKKLAFYSTRGGRGEVYVMGANTREGPANSAVRLADNGSQADFSPSGEKIAYSGPGKGNYVSDVFVMNADGSGKTNLTHSARAVEVGAAWSPDGEEIAFLRSRRSEDTPSGGQQLTKSIWKMRSDGTGKVRLTTLKESGTWGLDWQPIP